MEYEKYYDKKSDGGYVIHFPNNTGISLSETEKMFSVHGKVLSVYNRGQAHGLCFVKYETLEDTERCIDGFQNHPSIKILPHKKKMKIDHQNQQLNNQDKWIMNKSSPVHGLNNRFSDMNKGTFTKRRYSYDQRDNRSDCSELKSLSTNNENVFNNGIVDNESCSDISMISSRSTNKTFSLRHFIKQRALEKAASSTSISSGTAEDTTKKCEEIIYQNEIPSLVCNDQRLSECNTRFSMWPSTIIPAEEVIVANIHASIGIHYILHLFEKYNPISVSLMMTIPKTGINYCHVYFKTTAEAVATEKEFDMCLLHGSSLIVLRSYKLTQEAL